MKALYTVLFFCSAIILTKAQIFSGEIQIKDNSNYYLNQVYVTNLNNYKTVKSDISGKFSIKANPGDIIRFTSIVTERKDVKITNALLENPNNFIELSVAYYDIEEVIIVNFKPTGNLKKDITSLKTGEKKMILKKAIGLPEPKGDGLPTQLPVAGLSGGGLTFGLNSIYDLISGEKKKKERAEKYEKMTVAIEGIKQYYGKSYFESLKIPDHLIDNFLQFVYTSDNLTPYIENGNYEAIGIFIEKYLPIYQKRLKNSFLLETIDKKELPK